MCPKDLFSLNDFSLKGRATAMHYRTMMGRLNLWSMLFLALSAAMLYIMGFPLVDMFRSLVEDDHATMDGIIQMMRGTEIAIFLISAAVMLYLFILSIGAMIMRLHDFGRTGWLAPFIVIIPALVDSLVVDVMQITQIGWLVLIVGLFLLYREGDFGKNAYGYDSDPKEGFSLSLQLISILPLLFIIADLALTVFIL